MVSLQPYLRVAVSKMIKDIVEPMFADMLPGPLKNLHFKKVDLGPTPFVFSNVDVHKMEGDSIKLDMDVDWDGLMDVELCVKLVGVPVNFGVEHVKINGRLSILLNPLIDTLPLISAMQVGMINPPHLDLDFTGAADALDISLIDDTIRKIINDVVCGILVLPNRMLVKMDPLNDLYKSYMDPMAFIRIKVVNGSGFKTGGGLIKDVPDVYCMLKFGANPTWNTSTKNNDETPEWNEEHDFLLSDHDQLVTVELYDSDFGSDTNLGKAEITVGDLLLAGKSAAMALIPKGEKEPSDAVVNISCEILNFTTDPTSLQVEPSGEEHQTNNGLLTVLVPGAYKLVGAREEMKTQVFVDVGDQQAMGPLVMDMPGIDVNNPCSDIMMRVLLTPEIVAEAPDIKVTLKNDGEPIGEFAIPFADVMGAPEMSVEEVFDVESGGTVKAKAYLLGITMDA